MSYETVQGLYDRLKKEDPEKLTNLGPQDWTRMEIAKGKVVSHNFVKKTDKWNILRFYVGKSSVKEVLNMLEPLLKEHGGDLVDQNGSPIDPNRFEERLCLALSSEKDFMNSHLNADRAFERQFLKIAEVIKDRDLQLVWLRKNVPESQTVYCVGDKFYFSFDDLRKDYNSLSLDWAGQVFDVDDSRVSVCKLPPEEMKTLFYRPGPEETCQLIKECLAKYPAVAKA